MRLDEKRLGLAGGVLWGAVMFILTALAIKTGYAEGWLSMMGSVYPNYDVSWKGSFLGLIYGFIDGFVGLYVLGWLYNKFAKL